MDNRALMFQFPDETSASKACSTLDELGYDPQPHGVGRLHIHVEREDLTSALEIVQSHGGELIAESPAEDAALTAAAYDLDALPIPAHTVNEDWDPAYFGIGQETSLGTGGTAGATGPGDGEADDGSYNRFDVY